LPDHALYGGSKIVPQYLVEALARDFGHRGVTVNSILPTAIKGVARGLPCCTAPTSAPIAIGVGGGNGGGFAMMI